MDKKGGQNASGHGQNASGHSTNRARSISSVNLKFYAIENEDAGELSTSTRMLLNRLKTEIAENELSNNDRC